MGHSVEMVVVEGAELLVITVARGGEHWKSPSAGEFSSIAESQQTDRILRPFCPVTPRRERLAPPL